MFRFPVNVLSAREGRFSFPRAAQFSLRLGFLSFFCLSLLALLAFSAAADDPSPAPDTGEDLIVVTATRLTEPVNEVPAAVSVVTSEQIRASQAATVGELLLASPQADVKATGGAGSIISARLQGASSSQVQVLVDGRPVNNNLTPVDLAMIPLADVERIEVVQGPVSSLYGANALGGVVNIITRRPESAEKRISVAAGGFGERRLDFSAAAKEDGASWLVTGSTEKSDGWRQNSDSARQALTGRMTWGVAGGEADLRLSYSGLTGGSPGPDGDYGYDPTPLTRNADQLFNLDLSYRGASPDAVEARLYHSAEVYDYDDPSSSSHHQAWWNGLEAHRALELGSHQLVIGGEYRADEASSTNMADRQRAENLGLYAEDMYKTGEWSWTLGGRLDSHSAYGTVLSPRIGATRQLSPENRLWLSVGKAFRAPSFEDLYWKEDTYTVGNPDLRPETAIAYEGGLTVHSLDLKVFHKDVSDNIHWGLNSTMGKYQPLNLGQTLFDGVEVAYHKRLGASMTATASYAILSAVDAVTNQALTYEPAYRGSLQLSSSYHKWNWTAALRLVGSQWVDALDKTTYSAYRTEAPAFTVVDLSAVKALGPQAEVQISVKNALNASYEEVPGYPMPGACLTVGLSRRF